MSRIPRDLRVIVAFAFTASAGDAALVTLLPSIRGDLQLTGVQAGAVVSATTLLMLATAVPAGMLAGRIGTKPILRAAGLLLPFGLVGLALAPSLPLLLASRAVFGISFGVLWVIGPLRVAAAGRGARGTGLLIGAAGAGWLLGPLVAGGVADLVGWRWPLLGLAALSAPVGVALAADRVVAAAPQPLRVRDALAVVRRERAVVGALLVSGVLGVISGTGSILVPAVLSDSGLSAGAIGLVLALSAVGWTLAAPLSGRAGGGAVDMRLVGIAVAVLGVSYLVPAVSLSTGAVVFFVLVSAACRAAVNTFAYAIGAGTPGGESTSAAVIALMNAAWAAAALVSPIVAGAAESDEAIRFAFATTAVLGLAVAAWLVGGRRPALASG